MGDTGRKRVRIPLLLPLCLAILLLVAGSIGGIVWVQFHRVREHIKSHLSEVEIAFQEKLAEDAENLSVILDFLKEDESLRQAWLAKDRDALLSSAIDIFENIRSEYRVTHFYFQQPDRVCFLRVHNPPKYGDYINRLTRFFANSAEKNNTRISQI